MFKWWQKRHEEDHEKDEEVVEPGPEAPTTEQTHTIPRPEDYHDGSE